MPTAAETRALLAGRGVRGVAGCGRREARPRRGAERREHRVERELTVPASRQTATAAHVEPIVEALDGALLDGRIRWRTARNIWGEVRSAFRQACRSKLRTLRVRDDDPTVNVPGPERGVDKLKPILYPDEALALLGCERVSLLRRRAYACAIYAALRSNELAALTAADIDRAHLRISIVKQREPTNGKHRAPKMGRARSFDLEPALAPLADALVDEHPHGALLDMPDDSERASTLRDDLLVAGVDREDLFVLPRDPLRAPITLHRLRDTGLCWMAVRGDDPLRIQCRGGHTDFRVTQGYIAASRNLGPGFGTPFPPLPKCLLEHVPV